MLDHEVGGRLLVHVDGVHPPAGAASSDQTGGRLLADGQQVLVEKPGGDQDDSGHSYPEQGVDRLTEHFRPLGPHRDEEGQSACRRGVPQAAGESLEEDVAEIGQDQADNGRALARQGGRGHIHPVAEVDGHPLNALAGLRSDSGRVAQG